MNNLLPKHVSGILMPIFRSARQYIIAYGLQHLMCCKPYAIIYGLALMKMGINDTETR